MPQKRKGTEARTDCWTASMIWANMASMDGWGWEGTPWSSLGDGPVGVASPYGVPLEYGVGGEERKLDMVDAADAADWTRAGKLERAYVEDEVCVVDEREEDEGCERVQG